ncbi:sushi, nidogen and EGF-like domain-containing protein 1 [Puntigrus tetrazona]|uniref:sushi, nidogen and EGF-like domain-containing protein 1 n=1 Tax=Puntigrus tetrazona TaxID=1606681 RepID=UPI001C89B83A|nr:sushi, nidogen and EGF-like domain-containing protein 1 [Puntigrus tetrazona]
MALLYDPCYNYTVLDDLRRATSNQLQSSYYARYTSKLLCDQYVNWVGWYRLFIRGQSVQMPDTCVDQLSCGTHAPLWLTSPHPRIEDGVVIRNVCGNWWNDCCGFRSNPIKVKACPGNYYVYEFVQPNFCFGTYCADVRNISIYNFTSDPAWAAPAIFYPFGSAAGDTNSSALEDGSSPVIQLSSSFLFFGHSYQQIYVNNNGYLTFNQALSEYTPYSFPANRSQDIIAGLWTDLDNRVKGVVSYQQYINGGLLNRANQDIKTYFPDLNFIASWVFVATWDKVAYYALTNTETSFQIVLISGGNYSFILMNYGDIAVTEHPVQAGYDTISSTNYFVIPGSNLGSFISNLRNSSNVGVPGRWVFRVDSEPNKNNIVGLKAKLTSFSDLTDNGNIQMVLDQLKQVLVRNGLSNSIELKLRKVQKIKP